MSHNRNNIKLTFIRKIYKFIAYALLDYVLMMMVFDDDDKLGRFINGDGDNSGI